MTSVYVVRHAIAEDRDWERWPDDSLRPLTAEGEASFRRAARGLRTIAPRVDEVLASPYARAWRTAELLHEEAGWPEPVACAELEATGSPEDVVSLVRGRDSVALVGHEPVMSEVVSLLVGGSVPLDFKKGGVVLVEDRALRWYATPKILRGLAR